MQVMSTMRGWRIEFGGHTWTDQDATTGHLVALGELGLDDWSAVSPWTSPRMLAAWLTVLVAGSRGTDLATASLLVNRTSVGELLGILTEPDQGPEPEGDT